MSTRSKELLGMEVQDDARFIAIGVGNINLNNLHYWHSMEVDMVASMT